jgi:hypothetical protein
MINSNSKSLDDIAIIEKDFEETSEAAWNNLSDQDKLNIFCAISRKIYQGEIVDSGTYRYVLYEIFKFGPEAYMPAQISGYLSIHNAIYDSLTLQDLKQKFKDFSLENGIDENKVKDFMDSNFEY